jgi:hypothetical protein
MNPATVDDARGCRPWQPSTSKSVGGVEIDANELAHAGATCPPRGTPSGRWSAAPHGHTQRPRTSCTAPGISRRRDGRSLSAGALAPPHVSLYCLIWSRYPAVAAPPELPGDDAVCRYVRPSLRTARAYGSRNTSSPTSRGPGMNSRHNLATGTARIHGFGPARRVTAAGRYQTPQAVAAWRAVVLPGEQLPPPGAVGPRRP